MVNPFKWVLLFYVRHSRRFKSCVYEMCEDGCRCPVCGFTAPEPWKICEHCFYPLPLIGGSKPGNT